MDQKEENSEEEKEKETTAPLSIEEINEVLSEIRY